MRKIYYSFLLLFLSSCESFLDITPGAQITSGTFWESLEDAEMAVNGVYSVLRSSDVYGYGGGMDACTPNAYQWAWWEGDHMSVGNGSVFSASGGIVDGRWGACYQGIYRANYFFENIDKVPGLSGNVKNRMLGEVYFLRAIFYDLLVRTYGDVPLITSVISAQEARSISRTDKEAIWKRVFDDFDKAIDLLPINAEIGRITKGAAIGMKMKSKLFRSEWTDVLNLCNDLISLNKYSLFPSYKGLFQFENEGNSETVFAISFMAGKFDQGSYFDRGFQPQNIANGIDGSNSVAPTQILVDKYETLDGSPIDPENPYVNRDPRLDFTVLRPGAYFQGQLYPIEIQNHAGCKLGFSFRKYLIETMKVEPYESPLDFMVLRYADVLLCKSEALIELNSNLDEAISIINRIRTERNDVKLLPIPMGLSQEDARKNLRHEREIELALEGQFWDDIKRWNIGYSIYPCTVVGAMGEILEVKFPNGYNSKKDNLLPLPADELGLNSSLVQNSYY